MPTNDFYDSSGAPSTSSSLSSSTMRAEFDAIEAGFVKLPTLAGNANKAVVVNAGATALTVGGTLSGTNTGDQTITLTGNVTGAGTGSFAATIAADAVTTGKINDNAVTYAKMQDISATDRLLGRSTAGAGDTEEIVCTAFGRSLIDDANAAAGRITLNVETAATGSTRVTVGTTAQRDGSPASGYFRLNTTTNEFEGYKSAAWGSVGGTAVGSTLYLNSLYGAFN